jgi:hypothetical protein
MTNLQKYECSVCHKELALEDKTTHKDYICSGSEDHHYSIRIKDGVISKLRVRFDNDKDRMVLKVHYDEGYSEVWSQATYSSEGKIKLNQIVPTNFEDIPKLKNKIRTILVFS